MPVNYICSTIKKFSGNFILLLLVFLACLAVVFMIGDYVFEDNQLGFDNKVFDAIAPYITDQRTSIIQFFTFFGSSQFLLPAYIVVIVIFLLKKNIRFHSWKILLIGVMGTGVMFGLKSLLERQRPLTPLISQAHGYSFPSGHAFSAMVFFGLLAYFVYRSNFSGLVKVILITLLVATIILVGFSRIYLKVHFATDVIAGWLLGLMWLLIAKYFLVYRRKKLPKDNEVMF